MALFLMARYSFNSHDRKCPEGWRHNTAKASTGSFDSRTEGSWSRPGVKRSMILPAGRRRRRRHDGVSGLDLRVYPRLCEGVACHCSRAEPRRNRLPHSLLPHHSRRTSLTVKGPSISAFIPDGCERHRKDVQCSSNTGSGDKGSTSVQHLPLPGERREEQQQRQHADPVGSPRYIRYCGRG
jgi:hypothetical protein